MHYYRRIEEDQNNDGDIQDLDELEILLKGSRKVPMTGGKSIIETSRFLDRVDRNQSYSSGRTGNSQIDYAEKERIVSDACAEADKYLEHSKSHVALLVDDNEITRSARGLLIKLLPKVKRLLRRFAEMPMNMRTAFYPIWKLYYAKPGDSTSGRDDIRDGLRNNDY